MSAPQGVAHPAPSRLEGKVALVVGGGRGIGRASVDRLAAEGAAVVVADVDGDNAKHTAADIAERGGRSVGVRFTLPLWDDTEYTVTIDDVASLGGGPTGTISETFRTPAAEMFLLQRGTDDGDMIYRTDLTGQNAVPVFRHAHIEDFRATGEHLVVSVRTDDDQAGLIVTDLDGEDARELPLPGDGFISNLQSADRGERIGYTFSDAELDADTGRAI